MFLRFIFGALRYRKQRLTLAFAALAVAATLSTVLFGIYGTVEQRIREQFSAYGANIVAVPLNGTTVPLTIAAAAERLGAEAAPFLVTSGRIGEETVAVAGFDVSKSVSLTSFWHMQGSRDIAAGECIAGEFLAARLQWKVGSAAGLQGAPCTVKGIVSTGGAEDGELLLPFDAAASLAGLNGDASLIEIRAPGERVEAVRIELAKEFPAVDMRTIVAVASTESNVVLKIRASLLLLTLLILAITTLCVSSNFSEMVIERSKEIGILKALGAAERRIAAFFVSEAAALAMMAALAGYTVGVFAAAGIGQQVFGGTFRPEVSGLVFGGVLAVMLAVAAIATGVAASRIWGIQPAIILRGE
jgi:putative ABC transport system permease protein